MPLKYDHLEESEETATLYRHHKASQALSTLTNRFQNSSSSTSSPKVTVLLLYLDKFANKAMKTRQASTQLSRPDKLKHLAIEDKENIARVC